MITTGFPVLTVRRDYSSNNVSLSQVIILVIVLTQSFKYSVYNNYYLKFKERFLIQNRSNTTLDKTIYLWWTPLTYTADFKTIGSTWLSDNQTSKNLTLDFEVKENQWLIFNVDETGL